jgi:pimeloyl-ACP methyl ester carboxylesterase
MAEITDREQRQIDQANSSGKTPVVFIHGLWLLPSSWDNWVGLFEESGYAGVTPSWPDDPETVEEARANPDVLAKKTLKQVADHTAKVIDQLDTRPAVMGHSTGGLLTYMIADRGLSAASVAIDAGPFRGVLPLPLSALKSASPVLRNPLNRGRAITLTFDQFKYGWANALDDKEARHLYDTYHVAAPRGGPDADGERKPQSRHRGQSRSQESRPWPAADHRGREGPHRPVGDRQRRLQAPEAQRVRHRDHQDPEPRALAHDRQRLA